MEFVKKYLRLKKSLWRLQSVYVVDQVGRVLCYHFPLSLYFCRHIYPKMAQNSQDGPKFVFFLNFHFFHPLLKMYTYYLLHIDNATFIAPFLKKIGLKGLCPLNNLSKEFLVVNTHVDVLTCFNIYHGGNDQGIMGFRTWHSGIDLL